MGSILAPTSPPRAPPRLVSPRLSLSSSSSQRSTRSSLRTGATSFVPLPLARSERSSLNNFAGSEEYLLPEQELDRQQGLPPAVPQEHLEATRRDSSHKADHRASQARLVVPVLLHIPIRRLRCVSLSLPSFLPLTNSSRSLHRLAQPVRPSLFLSSPSLTIRSTRAAWGRLDTGSKGVPTLFNSNYELGVLIPVRADSEDDLERMIGELAGYPRPLTPVRFLFRLGGDGEG